MDTLKLIGQYVALRDRIKAEDDAHKAKMGPFREMLEQMNGMLLNQINTTGGNSIATDNGTAYITVKKSATIADAAAFRRFVIGSEAWDLIDFRANAPAVDAFLEEHQQLPPGLNYTTRNEVGVKRPTTPKSK